ncbi:helix-turn-helix transcriptional regulator [Methylopila capsulata]|uniref:Transcriptional activator protein BjaR1 n=2 Tax=Methylopila capsulata TaxID=61654 RepID=A0A9W6ISP8_9HYPH|nr:LuxR family transcriptional regulator [Methylopila capsulata]GLK54525.1 transcriptional activator protein BjaR1 [Methylopila capsulata]
MVGFTKVQEAIEAVTQGGTPEDVFRELLKIVEPYGLTNLIAGTMPSPRSTKSKAKQHLWSERHPPGWMERYLQKGYVFDDPVIRRIHGELSAFRWRDAPLSLGIESRQRLIMNEARDFGLRDGLAVPIVLTDGSLGSVSFGGSHVDVPPEAVGAINLIAIYAMGRAVQLRTEAEIGARARLTPREVDALRWAAEGKTLSQIGTCLGISDRTVEHHLKSAAVKLGAANRAHTIAEAFRAGLIT